MAQQFHMMAAILCLPSRPFVVVPLEEYVTSSANERLPLAIDRVINIQGGSLGVMVGIDMKGKPALMDQGPGPCVPLPVLRRELLLPTASQQRFLEEVLRGNSSMVDAKFSDDQLAVVPSTQGTSSKSEAKLYVCSEKLKAALQPLCTMSWPQMKESGLRLHTQKLQTVEGEARASGDQELASRASSLLDGALAVKQFLGRHREFSKSSAKTQTQKCEEICTDIIRVEEFLARLGQPAAISLKVFARKAEFVSIATRSLSARASETSEWVPPLDKALNDFIDGGIVEVLTARATESVGTYQLFNVPLWLNELVKETLCLLSVQNQHPRRSSRRIADNSKGSRRIWLGPKSTFSLLVGRRATTMACSLPAWARSSRMWRSGKSRRALAIGFKAIGLSKSNEIQPVRRPSFTVARAF
jgi:hypothetical protein